MFSLDIGSDFSVASSDRSAESSPFIAEKFFLPDKSISVVLAQLYRNMYLGKVGSVAALRASHYQIHALAI
ncbi:hypothetical protein C7B80_21775 [Cyanosarcina cf. burmensis CCALA 770]|nr:hypothetical protein C7B80_21775 [Cyanosarcina cf. burmensis CCALA 770]